MKAMPDYLRVEAFFSGPHGGRVWRVHCKCGWTSKGLPFPDPDAALHAGHLHLVAAHDDAGKGSFTRGEQ